MYLKLRETVLAFAMCASYAAFAENKDVLIITGQNNHGWRETTPKLEYILKDAGGFNVKVCDDVSKLTPASFKGVDLIISNWNSFPPDDGKMAQREALWTPEIRKAFENAVESGTGHVVVHAGSASNFSDWPNWKNIVLGTFVRGTTHHAMRGQFLLEPKKGHPITDGLPENMYSSNEDELWNDIVVVGKDATPIIFASPYKDKSVQKSGDKPHQISALVGIFGKGRCFTTFLGHNARAMDEVFSTIFIRGCQWAAGEEPTFKQRFSNDATNDANMVLKLDAILKSKKPNSLNWYISKAPYMSERSKCVLLCYCAKSKNPKTIDVCKMLMKSDDSDIRNYAVRQYALCATPKDYPFFANYCENDKHTAVRAADLVRGDDAFECAYNYFKTAKNSSEKRFYLELMGLQNGSSAKFIDILDILIASKDFSNISYASSIADISSFDAIMERIEKSANNPDLTKALLGMFVRICARDGDIYKKFMSSFESLEEPLKTLVKPVYEKKGLDKNAPKKKSESKKSNAGKNNSKK